MATKKPSTTKKQKSPVAPLRRPGPDQRPTRGGSYEFVPDDEGGNDQLKTIEPGTRPTTSSERRAAVAAQTEE